MQGRPFVILSKRDKRDAGLTRAASFTQEGDMAGVIVVDKEYGPVVYKNQTVGHKPPHLVPFLTTCWFAEVVPKDRRGNPLPPVVACYPFFGFSPVAWMVPTKWRRTSASWEGK